MNSSLSLMLFKFHLHQSSRLVDIFACTVVIVLGLPEIAPILNLSKDWWQSSHFHTHPLCPLLHIQHSPIVLTFSLVKTVASPLPSPFFTSLMYQFLSSTWSKMPTSKKKKKYLNCIAKNTLGSLQVTRCIFLIYPCSLTRPLWVKRERRELGRSCRFGGTPPGKWKLDRTINRQTLVCKHFHF